MQQEINSTHCNDCDGHPAGGRTTGIGLDIGWQDGPLGRDNEREEPNGCFVETVIAAAIDRIEYYQNSKFRCEQNAGAIVCLRSALDLLRERTEQREARQVEGTHAI